MDAQPYDSAVKNLLLRFLRYIIPVINELFGTSYTENAEVHLGATELVVPGPDRKIIRRLMDSIITVTENSKKQAFHIEVESSPDKSIQIRFLEYGSIYGNLHYRVDAEGHYVCQLPKSALICLRPLPDKPKELVVFFENSEGRLRHTIKVLYMDDYTVGDIKRKNLLFLSPFLLFRHEKDLDKIEKDPVRLAELHEEFSALAAHLKTLRNEGTISSQELAALLETTERVSNNLAAGQELIRKEVDSVMHGEIWKLAVDEAVEEERSKRIQAEKVISLLITQLRENGCDDAQVVARLESSLGMSEAEARATLSAGH